MATQDTIRYMATEPDCLVCVLGGKAYRPCPFGWVDCNRKEPRPVGLIALTVAAFAAMGGLLGYIIFIR